MQVIKGITWDHPRGYNSIVAATEACHQDDDGYRVEWDKRSLKNFGDAPLKELTDRYDLLIIDHPFVGEAHARGLLTPLDDILPTGFLQAQSILHVGLCYESYTYAGRQYALPVDAAAQFTAFNSRIIAKSDVPRSWSEYLELMRAKHVARQVLWPLCPTDLWCSFLTLAAQVAGITSQKVFNEEGLNIEIASEALELLKRLTDDLVVECWDLNPIQTLELLSEPDHYSFSPLIFGYSSYSRKELGETLFTNAIGLKGQDPTTLLGGAGIAVSSMSHFKIEIADYLKCIMSEDILAGPYFEAGGQPSLLSMWNSDVHNTTIADFFQNTLDTMNHAFVRPRVNGFHVFQVKAADLIHKRIRHTSAAFIVGAMNELYRAQCT